MECCYCAQKVHIFNNLSEDELRAITEMTQKRFFKKGDIIFNEGDTLDFLYIVHSGRIKVYKINSEGKEQILYVLSDGDTVGEYNLFKETKATFYAEALTDVRLCLLTKGDFYKVLSVYSKISLKIMRYMSDRLMKLEVLLKDLSTEDVETRLKAMLLKLCREEGKKTLSGIEIDFHLNREDLANLLGTTRETISRKLHKLANDGVIEFVSNKKILVKNLEKLEEI